MTASIGWISMKFVFGIFIKIYQENSTSVKITRGRQFTVGPKRTSYISLNFSCV